MVSGVVRRDISVYNFNGTSIRIGVDIDPICNTCINLDTDEPKAVFPNIVSSQTSGSVVTVEGGIEWHQVVGIVERELGPTGSGEISCLRAKFHIPQLSKAVELHLAEHEHGLRS
jgi:hypothetical protein